MKLSVIIPIYNAEKYMQRCLDSVIDQGLDDIEIICINDGSTDNSLNILEKYEKENKNIFVYTQKNSYAGTARNLGLSKAKGEYIHFLDADDYILPRAYRLLIEFAEKIQADIIKFKSYSYDAINRNVLLHSDHDLRTVEPNLFGKILSARENINLLSRLSPVPWGYLVKRDFINVNKIYFNQLKCVNDRSFYCDIITRARDISFYEGYIVMHKVNDKSSLAGGRRKQENYICFIKSCQIIYENTKDMPNEIRSAILNNEFRCLANDFNFLRQEAKILYSPIILEQVFKKYVDFLSPKTLSDQYVRKLYAMMAKETFKDGASGRQKEMCYLWSR